MVETEDVLNESDTALFGADNVATVIMFPKYPNERWEIGRMSTDATVSCELKVYRTDTQPRFLIDTTKKGAADISDNFPPHYVYQGDRLIFVWTANSAIVGTQRANVRIEGKRFVPGNRAYGSGR